MKSGKDRKIKRKPKFKGLIGFVDSGTSFSKIYRRNYNWLSKNSYRKQKRYGVEVES